MRYEVGACVRNRERMVDRAHDALHSGADVVVFPELAVSGYSTDTEILMRAAEPLDGPTMERMTQVSRGGAGLVVYGFCERADGVLHNTVVIVGPDGPLLHYRKLHPFDRENDVFAPGDLGLPVIDTQYGRLAACVCYDVRFVEVLRLLSLQGADIVFAPAAWVSGFDTRVPAGGTPRQGESVIAQANLDQVAVVAVSQVGSTGPGGTTMLGGSIAVDAYGELLAGPLSRLDEDGVTVTIDVEVGRMAQDRGPRIRPRADRRIDVYGLDYAGDRW